MGELICVAQRYRRSDAHEVVLGSAAWRWWCNLTLVDIRIESGRAAPKSDRTADSNFQAESAVHTYVDEVSALPYVRGVVSRAGAWYPTIYTLIGGWTPDRMRAVVAVQAAVCLRFPHAHLDFRVVDADFVGSDRVRELAASSTSLWPAPSADSVP